MHITHTKFISITYSPRLVYFKICISHKYNKESVTIYFISMKDFFDKLNKIL